MTDSVSLLTNGSCTKIWKSAAISREENRGSGENLSDEVHNNFLYYYAYNFWDFVENSGIKTAREVRRIIEAIRNESRISAKIGSYVATLQKDSRDYFECRSILI